ncbi:MAG: hypothetical protein J6K77_01465 [Ruminococcus sp.]|nr:hypothetical protein [Ruminococcus sp.]
MDENEKMPETPEELADLIDSLMSRGSGHINIIADENAQSVNVSVVNSTDYCGNKGACCQPTESSIDGDDE